MRSYTEIMEKWKPQLEPKDAIFQRSYLRPLFVDLRCPECRKLYRIDTRDIISDSPHFDCIQCKVTFKVEADPNSPRNLITKTANQMYLSHLNFQELNPEAIRRCLKCGATNLKSATECLKCGVIFEKAERSEREGGVLPSLARAWSELLQDYNNITKHISFVDQCEELQAVPFALKKYQDLRELQPFDEITLKMHEKVLLKNFAKKSFKTMDLQLFKNQRFLIFKSFLVEIPWGRYFRVITWFLPIVFILWGLFHVHLRNLVGLGVSFLFLRIAVQLFIKGEINFRDIWKP